MRVVAASPSSPSRREPRSCRLASWSVASCPTRVQLDTRLSAFGNVPEGDGARGGSGFVVHNSPMTTPELQAVNFARTVR